MYIQNYLQPVKEKKHTFSCTKMNWCDSIVSLLTRRGQAFLLQPPGHSHMTEPAGHVQDSRSFVGPVLGRTPRLVKKKLKASQVPHCCRVVCSRCSVLCRSPR